MLIFVSIAKNKISLICPQKRIEFKKRITKIDQSNFEIGKL
jgi:hypothetical protein